MVLDLCQLPHERNFEYLEKNGVLKFLEQAFRPGNFSGSCLNQVHKEYLGMSWVHKIQLFEIQTILDMLQNTL